MTFKVGDKVIAKLPGLGSYEGTLVQIRQEKGRPYPYRVRAGTSDEVLPHLAGELTLVTPGLGEGRLNEIRVQFDKMGTAALAYGRDPDLQWLLNISENGMALADEVRLLEGRLESVCAVLSDAEAMGEPVSPERILEAVRG